MGLCISWSSALCLNSSLGPQLVFTGPGTQFVFADAGPQIVSPSPGAQHVFIDPDRNFAFTGPSPQIVLPILTPVMAPNLYLPVKEKILLLLPQYWYYHYHYRYYNHVYYNYYYCHYYC